MWIIVDKRIWDAAKLKLSQYGALIELDSHEIVYTTIRGHPDIFMCQVNDELILAPNAPKELINRFEKEKIKFTFGNKTLRYYYPGTAFYNAVVTNNFIIHKSDITDDLIKDACKNKTTIHVNQGYTRCNLLALDEQNFITSDKGIEKALIQNQLNVLYVDPDGIELSGYKSGFFGGSCGVYEDKIFINGSLEYYSAKNSVRDFVNKLGYQIIELYDGPLRDVGSIFFVNS